MSSENLIPKIGQILYKEYNDENGNFQHASLVFIDEEIKEGKQWMYTQIVCMEDFGEGMQVYAGFEAGGMPHKYTRLATDEDIKKFIIMIKNGAITKDSQNLEEWLEKIRKDEVLLKEEKDRIEKFSLI